MYFLFLVFTNVNQFLPILPPITCLDIFLLKFSLFMPALEKNNLICIFFTFAHCSLLIETWLKLIYFLKMFNCFCKCLPNSFFILFIVPVFSFFTGVPFLNVSPIFLCVHQILNVFFSSIFFYLVFFLNKIFTYF